MSSSSGDQNVDEEEIFEISDYSIASNFERFVYDLEILIEKMLKTPITSRKNIIEDKLSYKRLQLKLILYYDEKNDLMDLPLTEKILFSENDFPLKSQVLYRWFGLQKFLILTSEDSEISKSQTHILLSCLTLSLDHLNESHIPHFVSLGNHRDGNYLGRANNPSKLVVDKSFSGSASVSTPASISSSSFSIPPSFYEFRTERIREIPPMCMYLSGLLDLFRLNIPKKNISNLTLTDIKSLQQRKISISSKFSYLLNSRSVEWRSCIRRFNLLGKLNWGSRRDPVESVQFSVQWKEFEESSLTSNHQKLYPSLPRSDQDQERTNSENSKTSEISKQIWTLSAYKDPTLSDVALTNFLKYFSDLFEEVEEKYYIEKEKKQNIPKNSKISNFMSSFGWSNSNEISKKKNIQNISENLNLENASGGVDPKLPNNVTEEEAEEEDGVEEIEESIKRVFSHSKKFRSSENEEESEFANYRIPKSFPRNSVLFFLSIAAGKMDNPSQVSKLWELFLQHLKNSYSKNLELQGVENFVNWGSHILSQKLAMLNLCVREKLRDEKLREKLKKKNLDEKDFVIISEQQLLESIKKDEKNSKNRELSSMKVEKNKKSIISDINKTAEKISDTIETPSIKRYDANRDRDEFTNEFVNELQLLEDQIDEIEGEDSFKVLSEDEEENLEFYDMEEEGGGGEEEDEFFEPSELIDESKPSEKKEHLNIDSSKFKQTVELLEEEIRKRLVAGKGKGVGVEKSLDICIVLDEETPIYVPFTKPIPPMTEDMLRIQQSTFAKLGNTKDASRLRAVRQSKSLVSDMSAFKASNPNALFIDFVRWYSPSDVIKSLLSSNNEEEDDENESNRVFIVNGIMMKLSSRMSKQGNLWKELWKLAKAVPTEDQFSLLDYKLEGERIIEFFENYSYMCIFKDFLVGLYVVSFNTLKTHVIDYLRFPALYPNFDQLRLKIIGLLNFTRLFHNDQERRNFKLKILEINSLFENFEHLCSLTVSLVDKFRNVKVLRSLINELIKSNSCTVHGFKEKYEVLKMIRKREETNIGKKNTVHGGDEIITMEPETREFILRENTGNRMYCCFQVNRLFRVATAFHDVV